MGAQTERGRPLGEALDVFAAGLSHRGRVREQNEDALALLPEQGLFIVADGMGGHHAGEVASRAVVAVLPEMLGQRVSPASSPEPPRLRQAAREAIGELSRQLRAQSAGQPGLSGMGATVVLAWVREAHAVIAHLGDSRAYLYRRRKLRQLTSDHSLVAILLRHGEITADEAKNHPARGRLSRYVGMDGEARADVRLVRLQAGDRLLLCSDGLTGMIEDAAIAGILGAAEAPEPTCERLVKAANETGGRDNITVLVADIGGARVSFGSPGGGVSCQGRFPSK